jgi:hypothetical protein
VEKAIERHAAYALWFHPSDPTEWFDPQLRAILGYLDGERRRGRLWVTTMEEMAAYCDARERVQLRAERDAHATTLEIECPMNTSSQNTELTLLIPIAARPNAASVGLRNGDRVSAPVRFVADGSAHAIVNVPATAVRLQLTF